MLHSVQKTILTGRRCNIPYARHRSNEPFIRRLKHAYPKACGAKVLAHTVHDMHPVAVDTLIYAGAQYRHERCDIWCLSVFVDGQRENLVADQVQVVGGTEPRNFSERLDRLLKSISPQHANLTTKKSGTHITSPQRILRTNPHLLVQQNPQSWGIIRTWKSKPPEL
jgi:hypothetical protein